MLGAQDGDVTDSSSWTCFSGEVCEIIYDLQAPESLEQLRIGKLRYSKGYLNTKADGLP